MLSLNTLTRKLQEKSAAGTESGSQIKKTGDTYTQVMKPKLKNQHSKNVTNHVHYDNVKLSNGFTPDGRSTKSSNDYVEHGKPPTCNPKDIPTRGESLNIIENSNYGDIDVEIPPTCNPKDIPARGESLNIIENSNYEDVD